MNMSALESHKSSSSPSQYVLTVYVLEVIMDDLLSEMTSWHENIYYANNFVDLIESVKLF